MVLWKAPECAGWPGQSVLQFKQHKRENWTWYLLHTWACTQIVRSRIKGFIIAAKRRLCLYAVNGCGITICGANTYRLTETTVW